MKTPLELLKDKINKQLSYFNDKEPEELSLSERGLENAYVNCLKWIEELKDKEVEFAKDFFNYGNEAEAISYLRFKSFKEYKDEYKNK